MQIDPDVYALAEEIIAAARTQKLTLATVESCTGGLVAGALTAVPGSSDVFYGGYVTYANEAKLGMVGVPYGVLREFGAVSKEVAAALAEGGLAATGTHLCLAVTGIAGPGGGSADKPVGLVHFAVAGDAGTRALKKNFAGLDRAGVRQQSVVEALKLLRKAVGD